MLSLSQAENHSHSMVAFMNNRLILNKYNFYLKKYRHFYR